MIEKFTPPILWGQFHVLPRALNTKKGQTHRNPQFTIENFSIHQKSRQIKEPWM